MTDPNPRFREIFFEVYEHLPRQGPGSRASAARALGLCRELPASPAIIDLGCGVASTDRHGRNGRRTLHSSPNRGPTGFGLSWRARRRLIA